MGRLITRDINYSISEGNIVLDAIQVDGNQIMLNVEIAGLVTGDTVLELLQSVDGSEDRACVIPGSAQTLAIGQTSHIWTLNDLVDGSYLHVSVQKGSAAEGVITKIHALYNEQK